MFYLWFTDQSLWIASCYSDLKQQAGPGVSDFKFASRHFFPLHHPAAAHVPDNVVSKSFCLWLKSDSMWAFHIACLCFTSSLSIQLEYQLCAQLEFQLFHNCDFTLNPAWVEIPACCIRKFQSNPFPFFQHCLDDWIYPGCQFLGLYYLCWFQFC